MVRLNRQKRAVAAVLGLAICLACSALFLWATTGFYGTSFDTLSQALQPSQTLVTSDDVYPCNRLNGQGSDDSFSVLLLWALLPLLLWRIWHFRNAPGWGETVTFLVLSAPAALFLIGIATCANVALTLLAGKNLALLGCLLGWGLAAFGFGWPGKSR